MKYTLKLRTNGKLIKVATFNTDNYDKIVDAIIQQYPDTTEARLTDNILRITWNYPFEYALDELLQQTDGAGAMPQTDGAGYVHCKQCP